jgi:hypothetical protein
MHFVVVGRVRNRYAVAWLTGVGHRRIIVIIWFKFIRMFVVVKVLTYVAIYKFLSSSVRG